jgi:uncharacterized protein with HEPN domain
MLPERDRIRLLDMLDHSKEALQFIEGRVRSDLDTIRWLNLSLVRLLEIIGEAAARVSESTKSGFPEIKWQQIIGLRNRLIHGYNQVDFDIMWDILQEDLPQLIKHLEKALEMDST